MQPFELYLNLAANGTTVVKNGPGGLASININTKGATGNTLTLYDNTAASGTKLGTIDTTVAVGTMLFYVRFNVGLTVVLASGTSADVTISFA